MASFPLLRRALRSAPVVLVGLLVVSMLRGEEEGPIRLLMQDGQEKSQHIRVFVNRQISWEMTPELQLTASYSRKKLSMTSGPPIDMAPEYHWVDPEDHLPRTGTLLLFSAAAFPLPSYQPVIRVRPSVHWTDGGRRHSAVGERDVYLSYDRATILVTSGIVGLLLLLIGTLARLRAGSSLSLLASPNGRLSLSKVQIAAWTIAIGGVVTAFGLTRLQVPAIPESLVALMGLSLATGGLAYANRTKTDGNGKPRDPAAAERRVYRPRLADMITDFDAGSDSRLLSIAKAQMLFWTCLMLVLFISKSILEAGLWDIPWELVALMGFSQSGYVAPKIARQFEDRKAATSTTGGAEMPAAP